MAVAKTIDFNSEEYKMGQRIQSIRKERGLSQTQLGNMMDMDRAAISNYENGSKGEMGFKTVKRFADALGVSVSVLYGEEQEAQEPDSTNDILQGLNPENYDMLMKMAEALLLKQNMTA